MEITMVKILKNCFIGLLMLLGVMPLSAMLQQTGTAGVYPVQPVNKNTGTSGKSAQNLYAQELEAERRLAAIKRARSVEMAEEDENEESSFNNIDFYTLYKVTRGVTVALVSAVRLYHYGSKLFKGTDTSLGSKFSLGCLVGAGALSILDYCMPNVMGGFFVGAAGMDFLSNHINVQAVTELAEKIAIPVAEKVTGPVAQKTAEVAIKTATAAVSKAA